MSKFDVSNYFLKNTVVFTHEDFKKPFYKFLKKENAEEQIDFIEVVKEFQKITSEKEQIEKAFEIFNTYIVPKSQKELNLDSDNRSSITKKLESQKSKDVWEIKGDPLTLFNSTAKTITSELLSDNYAR
jgi:tRNA uridine 5-carbamoylmethylation protein Kti12